MSNSFFSAISSYDVQLQYANFTKKLQNWLKTDEAKTAEGQPKMTALKEMQTNYESAFKFSAKTMQGARKLFWEMFSWVDQTNQAVNGKFINYQV